tara:strand:+ start:84 stop:947 length:864 start_codon:yes stop_codon:yes gene_type:complete
MPSKDITPKADSKGQKVHNLRPSTFETIDSAVLEWVNKTLNIFTTTNTGWKKAPVIWMTAERAFQIKSDKEIRSTDSESLIFPLISIERTSVERTPVNQRPIPANLFPNRDYRGGSLTISRKINQNKTRNFATSEGLRLTGKHGMPVNNNKIVYQSLTIPMPVYYNLVYSINLRADYQQQMNEMMAPFMVYTGGINQFFLKKDEHVYEAFIEDAMALDNNLTSLGEEEKRYETSVNLRVLGYLIGSGPNQKTPKITKRENPVKIKFARERVMVDDVNPFNEKEGYRR